GERARIALVGVAHDVLLRGRGIGHRLPLDARREAGAAAAAQARGGHFLDDRRAADLPRTAQAGPSAGRLVVLEAGRAGLAGSGERQPLLPGDERVLLDAADRLFGRSVEDRVDVVE